MVTETTILNPLLSVYSDEAMKAGCPTDQVKAFILADYIAQPKQLEFHAAARECDRDGGPTIIAFGGAKGPGKSHAELAQAGLDDCQRIPGLKVLFLRKVQKSAAESLEDLTYRVFHKIEHTFTPSKGRITFPNGSRILLGGFNNDRDIDKYMGIEYDLIIVEEATQITFEKMNMLMGSLRTSRDDWRTRMYWSANPGGVGHLWFKDNIIEPYREMKSDSHLILGGHARFIPATFRDNMFLQPEYIMWLESLEGQLGEAWREGNWDSFEGMAFPGWDRSRHVVEPFKIPDWWVLWCAVDWGYAKPFCCLWFAKDVDRDRIYVYRELYLTQRTDRQQARLILENTPGGENIRTAYADPSMWARKNMDDQVSTTADEYRKEKVLLTRADNDRISGKRKIDRLLGDMADGKPGLQIVSTCRNLIRTLPSLPLDENRVEDVDTDAEDHAYDTLKYGLTKTDAWVEPKQSEQHPLMTSNIWSKF